MAKRIKMWNAEEETALIDLVASGLTSEQIARQLRRPKDSVRAKRAQLSRRIRLAKLSRQELKPAEGSLADAEAEFSAAAAPFKPKVTPAFTPSEEDSPANVWAAAEKRNDRELVKAHQRGRFLAELGDAPVAVVAVSDQHILEGGAVDLKRMREDAELIRATEGCYAVLGGDGVENHIKHRSAIVNTEGSPSRQWQLYEHYLQIIDPLVVISGNHDAWTKAIVGVDMVEQLARRNALCYAPAEARIELAVGAQRYRLALRHQYRLNSSFNQTHCLKQWLRLGDEEFDVGVICHHHEGVVETSDYRGVSRVFVRPGSYKATDSYSHQYGYNPTRPTCPTVVFSADRREMVAFADLRPAITYLNAIRG